MGAPRPLPAAKNDTSPDDILVNGFAISRAVHRPSGYLIVVLLFLSFAPLWGSDDCAAGPAAQLISQSAFAHGYLHGYEAGFHAGDADFHIANIRDLRARRELDRPTGYQSEFGARDSFRGGFRQGFMVGYEDSIAGRDFRGFENLPALAVSHLARPKDFDRGFEDGYKSGQQGGKGDLESDSDFDPGRAGCPAKPGADGRLPESSEAYCAGFVSAYPMGYTDGYLLASPGDAAVVASK
jgi:hypothetical protein